MKTKLILGSCLALAAITANAQWSLTGNAGLGAGNFLGTTDGATVFFRQGNTAAGRIEGFFPGNTYLGWQSGLGTTSGYFNTLIGMRCGAAVTTGNTLSGLGVQALYNNSTGYCNTAMGMNSQVNNTSGYYNTSSGYVSMNANTTGIYNAGFGVSALYNSNGSYNSAVGVSALGGNTTGNSNSALGNNAGTSAGTENNATALGANAVSNASNKVRIGDNNVTVVEIAATAVYTGSDARFKSNISESDVKGLAFISKLRPVAYNFETKKFQEFLMKNIPDTAKRDYLNNTDFTKSYAIRHTGFIAQEVEKAAKDAGYNFDGVHTPESDNDNYSLAYSQFVVPLVKAVQEQQAIIEKQNADHLQQIADLQKQLDELKSGKVGAATGVNQLSQDMAGFAMEQNVPNPFNGQTVIKYNLPQTVGQAQMAVYDLSGKQITTFPIQDKGAASITITSEKLAAGIYIYSIIADGKIVDSKRMVVSSK